MFSSSGHSQCRYMFDEPSSYLDVKQRLKAAVAIRDLLGADRCSVSHCTTNLWLSGVLLQVCGGRGA